MAETAALLNTNEDRLSLYDNVYLNFSLLEINHHLKTSFQVVIHRQEDICN